MAKITFLLVSLFLTASARAWAQTPFPVAVPGFAVPAPGVELAPWPWGEEDWPVRRCENLERELRDAEARLLELKTRYWAARLFTGVPRGLSSNPGSEIRDKDLRREFYLRLGMGLNRASKPSVTPGEIKLLRNSMQGQWKLIESCGGDDEELRRAYQQIVL